MTILGLHTAHELSDLLLDKMQEADDLAVAQRAAAASADTTQAPWPDWLTRYAAFLDQWNAKTAFCQQLIETDQNSLRGWDATTEEEAYVSLLDLLKVLDALETDFRAIPANPQSSYQGRPPIQPTAGDTDLNTLNAINNAPVVGQGGLIDKAVAEAETLTGPGTGTYWLIGGTALITLVAVAFLKKLL